MTSTSRISVHTAATAAMGAGLAAGVIGVIQITDTQSSESTVVGVEHVSLAGLTATLLLLVPLVLYLGGVANRQRAATVAVTGQVALAALTVVSNVRGEDPSFFAAAAVPSNLLMFGGWIALGIALYRGGCVPKVLAAALPFSWILLFPGSVIGLAVIAGGYYFALGWLLKHGELPRRAANTVAPASS